MKRQKFFLHKRYYGWSDEKPESKSSINKRIRQWFKRFVYKENGRYE